MAKYTDNCNLILPEQNENYDVDVANANNREIDFQLGNKVNKKAGKDLSTNDFTNEYKSKIDNLQKIYKFRGNVDTYTELNNIYANNGDIYNVLDEAKNYAWNGTEWVPLGFVIDMSDFAYKEEIPRKNSELENDSKFVDEETLNQIQDNIENAMKKNIIRFSDRTHREISTTSAWTDLLLTPIEIDVKKGKYMCVASFHIGTAGEGISTVRIMDGINEVGGNYRCSVPTAQGVTVSGNITFPIEIAEIHNIMPQIWSNVECDLYTFYLDLYEIADIDVEEV